MSRVNQNILPILRMFTESVDKAEMEIEMVERMFTRENQKYFGIYPS